MKTILSTLLFLVTVNFSHAQIAFRTGDKGLDAELNILNTEAKRDLTKFKDEVSKEYSLSKEKIQALLDKKMEPAEIILSGRIAKISKRPVDDVVKSYEKNKGKGWGVVAKEMGIKPGSAEFHALKGKPKKGMPADKGNKPVPQNENKEDKKPASKETPTKGKKKG